MTKFKLISSETEDEEPVGTILVGEIMGNLPECFQLTKDSELMSGVHPRWDKGEIMPIKGGLWEWEEIKEFDPRSVILTINGVEVDSFAGEVGIKRRFICDYELGYFTGLWLIDFKIGGILCISASCTKPTKRQIRKWRRECRKSQH